MLAILRPAVSPQVMWNWLRFKYSTLARFEDQQPIIFQLDFIIPLMIFPLLFNFSIHIKVFISGAGVPLQLNLEGSRLAFVPSSLPPSWWDKPPSLFSLPVVSVLVSPRELTYIYVHLATIQSWKNKVQILSPYWSSIYLFFAIILWFFLFSSI